MLFGGAVLDLGQEGPRPEYVFWMATRFDELGLCEQTADSECASEYRCAKPQLLI
jgi:hypothetical protein